MVSETFRRIRDDERNYEAKLRRITEIINDAVIKVSEFQALEAYKLEAARGE